MRDLIKGVFSKAKGRSTQSSTGAGSTSAKPGMSSVGEESAVPLTPSVATKHHPWTTRNNDIIKHLEFVRTTFHPQAWKYQRLAPRSHLDRRVACQVKVYTEDAGPGPGTSSVAADKDVYVQQIDTKSGRATFKQLVYVNEWRARKKAQSYLRRSLWTCYHSIVSDLTSDGHPIPHYLVLVSKTDTPGFRVACDPDYRLTEAAQDLAHRVAPTNGMVDYRPALAQALGKSMDKGWRLGHQLYNHQLGYQPKPRIKRISSATSLPGSMHNATPASSRQYFLVSSFFFPSEDKIEWEKSSETPRLYRAAYPMQGARRTHLKDDSNIARVQIRVMTRDLATGNWNIEALQQSKNQVFTRNEWNCYFPFQKEWPIRKTFTDDESADVRGKVCSSFPPPHMLLARKEHEALVSAVIVPPDVYTALRDLWRTMPCDGSKQIQGPPALPSSKAARQVPFVRVPSRSLLKAPTYKPPVLAVRPM